METLTLLGGFILAALVCYGAIDRLGRFLDRGGVSPHWDREEERAAGEQTQKDGCGGSDSKV